MSRSWIAFFMGDYQKDTASLTTLEHGAYFLLLNQCWQHGCIPLEPAKRASIAKLSLRDWNKIAAAINPYFNGDGTNKRASKEIAKAEVVRLRRQLSGKLGGTASGRSKAVAKGKQMLSDEEAERKQIRYQTTKQNTKPDEANHNSKILNTSLVAAREEEKQDGSLATAHFDSALREPKEENKPISALSRSDLEASFARRKAIA